MNPFSWTRQLPRLLCAGLLPVLLGCPFWFSLTAPLDQDPGNTGGLELSSCSPQVGVRLASPESSPQSLAPIRFFQEGQRQQFTCRASGYSQLRWILVGAGLEQVIARDTSSVTLSYEDLAPPLSGYENITLRVEAESSTDFRYRRWALRVVAAADEGGTP